MFKAKQNAFLQIADCCCHGYRFTFRGNNDHLLFSSVFFLPFLFTIFNLGLYIYKYQTHTVNNGWLLIMQTIPIIIFLISIASHANFGN